MSTPDDPSFFTPREPVEPATPEPTSTPASPLPGAQLRPLVAAGILTVVLAAFGGAALSHVLWPSNSTPSASANGASGGGLQRLFPQNSQRSRSSAQDASVTGKIDPGIVDINTLTGNGPAAGTGMVVTPQGEVITNNHVITGASSISVRDVGNGRTYSAHVVGYDHSHDVAVLQLENASGLATVPLGNSSTVHIGASVLTFGNAGGAGGAPSVAGGTIDAIGRAITAGDSSTQTSEHLRNLIEINGQIEPGDSGGPLVAGGKVVGMDTAASVGFSFQQTSGAGFAIPINRVVSIATKILAGKSSAAIHVGPTAIIGVYVANNNAEAEAFVNCPANDVSIKGVLVEGLVSGQSPASSAGIATCDIITGLDGATITSQADLLKVMETHHPGDQVSLTWADESNKSHSATITLGTGAPD
ncbi:MAG TPA: trypsin-like peptidase domain-containing protein [Solirubrobacteraceae bacterium]